jgi:hypothetical protein
MAGPGGANQVGIPSLGPASSTQPVNQTEGSQAVPQPVWGHMQTRKVSVAVEQLNQVNVDVCPCRRVYSSRRPGNDTARQR